MSVLFATKCWEQDWQKMLAGGFERKWQACDYPFIKKTLVFNNGVPHNVPNDFADSGIYDTYICATEIPYNLKGFFKIESLNNYSSGELGALYLAKIVDDLYLFDHVLDKTKERVRVNYLCYVQGDCITQGGDWITPAIKVLETEPDVLLVSPASEVNTWHDKDGYDHYCSDQAFVCRVEDMIKLEVYQVPGNDPDYPQYALDSFEAMVGRYMKKTGKKRKILPEFWVHHPAY